MNKTMQSIILIGLILILPISALSIVSGPLKKPAISDNLNSGNVCIDLAVKSWQNSHNGQTIVNHQKLDDFGRINNISPSTTGNSSGSITNPNSDQLNKSLDDRSCVSTVPEPMTLILLGLGSLGLAALRKRN